MLANSHATILVGKASPSRGFCNSPALLRRRAEKLISEVEQTCLLDSHSWLAELMSQKNNPGINTEWPDSPHWSLSRRNGYFAVAAHPFDLVGVDIEQVSVASDLDVVAFGYFPANLYYRHIRLATDARPRHFAACWSALEAVAKLRSLPLENAGAEIDFAVLYQTWISDELILSVALEQDVPPQLKVLTNTLSPSILKRVSSPLTEYL